MKTKIRTEVDNVIRDSDTTFKVKRSKIKVTGAGHIVAASAQLVISVKNIVFVGVAQNVVDEF